MSTTFSCLAPSAADYAVTVPEQDTDALFVALNLRADATGQVNPSELHGRIIVAMDVLNSEVSDDPARQEATIRAARVAYALGSLYSLAVEAQQAGLDIAWK